MQISSYSFLVVLPIITLIGDYLVAASLSRRSIVWFMWICDAVRLSELVYRHTRSHSMRMWQSINQCQLVFTTAQLSLCFNRHCPCMRSHSIHFQPALQFSAQLQCLAVADANPGRLERQICSGWRHTMGQPLCEVSRFTFSFDSALCKRGKFHGELYNIERHPVHSDIIFDPQAITAHSAFFAQNVNFVAASVPQT